MKSAILLTGASGFIGRHLRQVLSERGYNVRCAVRRPEQIIPDAVVVGEVDGNTNWREALNDVEVVIHLAGRAHVLKETSADPLAEFRRVNTQGTINLAQQMIRYGCRRLVFVSTIGVNGDSTPIDLPFTEASIPQPVRPYAIAKWEAEQQLDSLKNQLEIVVIRSPLVYGAGAIGNFGQLKRWVERGVPLPVGAANNRRSLVAVQNLCDFLTCCADHSDAANETFLISDGDDLSTPELIRRMASALERPTRLLYIPEELLRLPLRLAGREPMLNQLFGSLTIDSSKAHNKLGWAPLLSVDQALARLSDTTPYRGR